MPAKEKPCFDNWEHESHDWVFNTYFGPVNYHCPGVDND